jgi:hypothetical protein
VVLFHGKGENFDQTFGIENTTDPQKVWLSIAEQNNFILTSKREINYYIFLHICNK